MRVILVAFLLAATMAAANARLRRDVSEVTQNIGYNYPAAQPELDIPIVLESTTDTDAETDNHTEIATEIVPVAAGQPDESAVFSDTGYVYRSLGKLRYRYRKRRDVAHLNRDYLPPVKPPAADYLPPLPPVKRKPVKPQISVEYLPPMGPPEVEVDVTTVAVATTVDTEANTEVDTVTEPVASTEELADDGYHYKQPSVVPDLLPEPSSPKPPLVLLPIAEPKPAPESSPGHVNREYLPPVAATTAAPDLVPDTKTAVLADDGYHYRVPFQLFNK